MLTFSLSWGSHNQASHLKSMTVMELGVWITKKEVCVEWHKNIYRKPSSFPSILGDWMEVTDAFYKVQFQSWLHEHITIYSIVPKEKYLEIF